MAIIMKKYNINKINYLVLDEKSSQRNFSFQELAAIAQDESGISAEVIILVKDEKIICLNRVGIPMEITTPVKQIIEHFIHGNQICEFKLSEVRFTEGYINRIIGYTVKNMHIA